jgi:hypothetical protein
MKFCITDERAWSREFDAGTAEELAAGVRRAWDERIADDPKASKNGVHPGLAYHARFAEIDRWIEGRLAVATPTSDVRSWHAQANLWRFWAKRDYGADEAVSPLVLHVAAPDGWSTILTVAHARVARTVEPARAEQLCRAACATVEHAQDLGRLADHVGEIVRREQYPEPRPVDDAHEYRIVGPGGVLLAGPLSREEAQPAVREALSGRRPGSEAVLERRAPGASSWRPWRRYHLQRDGEIVRV